MKKVIGSALVILLMYGGYYVGDKYFNKAPAEANLKVHLQNLYNKQPDALTCANVDSSNYDSRVTCEARFGEEVKVYLCKGRFDGFDDSCIAPKFTNKL